MKDHNVAPAEFGEVIAQFQKRDTEFAGIYSGFTLMCPSLSESLRPIESGLARLRNAKPFYDDVAAATSTKAGLDERMQNAGLQQEQSDFIHAKVKVDIVQGDLHHDDRASDMFIAQLLKHPEYREMIRAAVEPAFAELLRTVDAKRGAVLGRADIEDMNSVNLTSETARTPAYTLGEDMANMLRSAAVALRTCTVRFSGTSGIRHSVDVTAESGYERLRWECRLSGRAAGPTPWRWEPNSRFKSESRPRATASQCTRFIGGAMGLRPVPTRR